MSENSIFVMAVFIVITSLCSNARSAESDADINRVDIVLEGNPVAAILLGKDATSQEKHAAAELQRYIKKMTDSNLYITSENDMGTNHRSQSDYYANVILIGKPDSHNHIKILRDKGLIDFGQPKSGHDSFIAKTVEDGGKHYLVLSSIQDRSVLYSVYHYLESVLHCGFFEDGEHIPAYQNIVAEGLDIYEESAFEYRWYPSYPGLAWSCFYFLYPEFEYLADWQSTVR